MIECVLHCMIDCIESSLQSIPPSVECDSLLPKWKLFLLPISLLSCCVCSTQPSPLCSYVTSSICSDVLFYDMTSTTLPQLTCSHPLPSHSTPPLIPPPPAPPGGPETLTFPSIGPYSVIITWDPPSDDGGTLDPLSYTVALTTTSDGQSVAAHQTTQTQLTFAALSHSENYTVSVVTVNSLGQQGPPAAGTVRTRDIRECSVVN